MPLFKMPDTDLPFEDLVRSLPRGSGGCAGSLGGSACFKLLGLSFLPFDSLKSVRGRQLTCLGTFDAYHHHSWTFLSSFSIPLIWLLARRPGWNDVVQLPSAQICSPAASQQCNLTGPTEFSIIPFYPPEACSSSRLVSQKQLS